MQASDAFKLGFLARCVEEGLSPAQTCALAKQAEEKQGFANPLKGMGATALSAVDSLFWPAAGAALMLPPTIGGGLAYLVDKSMNADTLDVDDVQKKELIAEYARMQSDLLRQKKLRKYRQELPAPKSVYL